MNGYRESNLEILTRHPWLNLADMQLREEKKGGNGNRSPFTARATLKHLSIISALKTILVTSQ